MCVCVKNNIPPEKKDSWAYRLSKHQFRGWRTVSAEGLRGKNWHTMSLFATHNHTHTYTHRYMLDKRSQHNSCVTYQLRIVKYVTLYCSIVYAAQATTTTTATTTSWGYQGNQGYGFHIAHYLYWLGLCWWTNHRTCQIWTNEVWLHWWTHHWSFEHKSMLSFYTMKLTLLCYIFQIVQYSIFELETPFSLSQMR